jgi:Protein of unknown function (DUF1064)
MSRRWTQADLDALQHSPASAGSVKKAHKYNAKRTLVDGIRFQSRLESRLYQEAKLRKSAGEFRPPYFLRQVPFHLTANVVYRADVVTFPIAGGAEVIDAKGVLTPDGRNKIKQVEELYGIKVILWNDSK